MSCKHFIWAPDTGSVQDIQHVLWLFLALCNKGNIVGIQHIFDACGGCGFALVQKEETSSMTAVQISSVYMGVQH